jgi:hypothetical protein
LKLILKYQNIILLLLKLMIWDYEKKPSLDVKFFLRENPELLSMIVQPRTARINVDWYSFATANTRPSDENVQFEIIDAVSNNQDAL